MAVTLKDIAQKAGVSISTASRIINNDMSKKASKETSDRVWQVVKELGYIPNQNARNLIKGEGDGETPTKTKAIGCIFTSKTNSYTDPFFSQIAIGIQKEIINRGYVMGYTFSSYEMTDSALYNNIVANKVDGAIILGRFSMDMLKFLKANIKNLLYVGINYVDGGFDEVICDGYRAACAAVQYLIDLGHQKIGFIGTVKKEGDTHIVNEHRFEGYKHTMEQHQLKLTESWIKSIELSTGEGYRAAKEMLENTSDRPTALFCANDAVAIGVMSAVHELGLSIPEDLSIIGIDNIEMAAYTVPPLTTIHVPKEELGTFAVKTLIDRIEDERAFPLRIDLPFELIERKTCQKIK
nr:LacI family DNA-binding transcriptional regulator [uncultured Niameybacter sp.]